MLRALSFAAIAAILAGAGCAPSYRAAVETTAAPTIAATPAPTIATSPSPRQTSAPPPVIVPSAPDPTLADLGPMAQRQLVRTPPTSSSSAHVAFSIDLYREGAFASQKTTYYCVPASIQVMLNLTSDGPPDRSRATQDDLYRLARDNLIQPYWGRGAQPEGWAEVLAQEARDGYAVAIRLTAAQAIRLAAKQLRLTNRPVGLLVWRGYHAWVMSGFTSIGDPAETSDFTVTGVYVEDPWYPRVSRTYGRSKPPDWLYSADRLTDFFLPYDQHGEGGLDKDGRFVVVIPVADN